MPGQWEHIGMSTTNIVNIVCSEAMDCDSKEHTTGVSNTCQYLANPALFNEAGYFRSHSPCLSTNLTSVGD